MGRAGVIVGYRGGEVVGESTELDGTGCQETAGWQCNEQLGN